MLSNPLNQVQHHLIALQYRLNGAQEHDTCIRLTALKGDTRMPILISITELENGEPSSIAITFLKEKRDSGPGIERLLGDSREIHIRELRSVCFLFVTDNYAKALSECFKRLLMTWSQENSDVDAEVAHLRTLPGNI